MKVDYSKVHRTQKRRLPLNCGRCQLFPHQSLYQGRF